MQLILYYGNLIKRHEEEKKMLDDISKMTPDKSSTVSADNIMQTVEDLYKLKHNGNKIKELYQHQVNSRNAEFVNSTEEYVLAQSRRKQQQGKSQQGGKNQRKSNEFNNGGSNGRNRNRSSSRNRQDAGNDSSNQRTKYKNRENNNYGQGNHNVNRRQNPKSGNQRNRNFDSYPQANAQYPYRYQNNFNPNQYPPNISPNQHPNNFNSNPNPHNGGSNYPPNNLGYQQRPNFGSNPNLPGNFNQHQTPYNTGNYMNVGTHFPNNGNSNFNGPRPLLQEPNQLPPGPGPYPLMANQPYNRGPPPSAFSQYQPNTDRVQRRNNRKGQHTQKKLPNTSQRPPSGPYVPDNIDSDSGLSTRSCPSGPYRYVPNTRTDSESQSSSDIERNSTDSEFDEFQRRHNMNYGQRYEEPSDSDNGSENKATHRGRSRSRSKRFEAGAKKKELRSYKTCDGDSDNVDGKNKAIHKGRWRNKSNHFEASAKKKESPSYRTYHGSDDDASGKRVAPKSENKKGGLDFFQKIFM